MEFCNIEWMDEIMGPLRNPHDYLFSSIENSDATAY